MSRKVSPGLGGGPEEEYGRIGTMMEWRWGLEGESGKEENRDDMERSEDGSGESQEEGTPSSTSC